MAELDEKDDDDDLVVVVDGTHVRVTCIDELCIANVRTDEARKINELWICVKDDAHEQENAKHAT